MACSAIAVLAVLALQSAVPARARESGYLAVSANASSCIDHTLPTATRISSCTAIIDWGAHASGAMQRIAAVAYVSRAMAFQQKGDDQAALRDFNAAAKLDPRSELPWLGLGNFYMVKSDYSRALANYDKTVSMAPKDPVAYDDRGAALVALRRNDAALADFARALSLDPRDTTALSNRATLYLQSNRSDLAIADLTAAIRIDPTSTKAFYNRGIAYEHADAFGQAVADYRSAVRLQSSFAPAHEALARVLARKDPQAAIAELTEALRLDPDPSVLRNRGIVYLSLRQFEPALRDFNEAIADDGSDSIAYLDRGVAEEQLGNLDEALRDFNRSIELQNTSAARVDRGTVYLRLGNEEKARADFDAAIAIEPKNVAALIGRADAGYAPGVLKAKRLAASLADYTRVIEAAPKNAAAYFIRGNIHFDLKEYAAAFSDYSESLALDANQPAALFNRSLTAEHLGRPAEAAQDRAAARQLDRSLTSGNGRGMRQAPAIASQIEYAAPQSTSGEPRVGFAAPRAAPSDRRGDTSQSPSQHLPEVTVKGYRRVVRNGRVEFCRTEGTAGSRAEKSTVCLTQSQLEAERQRPRELIQQIQRWSGIGVMPSMCGGAMGGGAGSSCFGVSPFGGTGQNPFGH